LQGHHVGRIKGLAIGGQQLIGSRPRRRQGGRGRRAGRNNPVGWDDQNLAGGDGGRVGDAVDIHQIGYGDAIELGDAGQGVAQVNGVGGALHLGGHGGAQRGAGQRRGGRSGQRDEQGAPDRQVAVGVQVIELNNALRRDVVR